MKYLHGVSTVMDGTRSYKQDSHLPWEYGWKRASESHTSLMQHIGSNLEAYLFDTRTFCYRNYLSAKIPMTGDIPTKQRLSLVTQHIQQEQ